MDTKHTTPTQPEFLPHLRVAERRHNVGSLSHYVADEDRTIWAVAGRIYGYSEGQVGESRGYRVEQGHSRVVFLDADYSVIEHQPMVTIRKFDGGRFDVPRGHAWFARVAEANARPIAASLYTELVALVS